MPKPHAPYSAEFRRRMLDMVRAGRTPESLSREFKVSAQSIRNWDRQADLDSGRRMPLEHALRWSAHRPPVVTGGSNGGPEYLTEPFALRRDLLRRRPRLK